jgi:hypothetical protein
MLEVNPNMAGLANHKYRMGECVVWADSLDEAYTTYQLHEVGATGLCDPKALTRAKFKMQAVTMPDWSQLY